VGVRAMADRVRSADLALVVSEVGDTEYRGHTVLTLEMALHKCEAGSAP